MSQVYVKREVKLKQIISHGDTLWAIDFSGNLWYRSSIFGWERKQNPTIEEPEF